MAVTPPPSGFISRDPRSGEVFGFRPYWHATELSAALARAEAAAPRWAATMLTDRCERLLALADALEQAKPDLARSVSREMGKLAHEAEDEVSRSAQWCRFLASRAPEWLSDPDPRLGYRPLGTILAVTPWNYPVWQILRPLAAALAAGNAVLVKPAGGVTQTSALIETLCRDLLPAGLMRCLWLDDAGTREALAHPGIAMLVFTGSEIAGRQLGALAGLHLKPAVLELGGNNAFLVLDDADIAAAARSAAASRCLNAGQACTAAKRFIVSASRAEAFTEALIDAMAAYRCGDTLAPLARSDLRARLAMQVERSVEAGATRLMGGTIPGGRGDYYPATVLASVRPGMPAFDAELFGPVAAICVAADDEDAVRLANAARQHLVASVWSADADRAKRLAGRLRAGLVCYNRRPGSSFELPFAGAGASGYGSTLGRAGLASFVQACAWLE